MTVLTGLMPNFGGPREERRRLLMSVVHSVFLYDSPTRAPCHRYYQRVGEEGGHRFRQCVPHNLLQHCHGRRVHGSHRSNGLGALQSVQGQKGGGTDRD